MNRVRNTTRVLCLLAIVWSTSRVAAQDYDPRVVGASFHGWTRDVAIAGSTAYVVLNVQSGSDSDRYATAGQIQVVDVSDPSLPVAQAYLSTPGSAYAVAVAGGYAYVADGEAGLSVIDVGDPLEPMVLRSIATTGFARDVVIDAAPAFVIVRPLRPGLPGPSSLEIFSIEAPVAPRRIASVDTPGRAEGLWIDDRSVYIADLDVGVTIVDVSVPEDPEVVLSIETPGVAWSVYVEGDRAFVADERNGLAVIDLSAPGDSVPVAIETATSARQVRVSERIAYVFCGEFPIWAGVQILDVSDPAAARELTRSTGWCGVHLHAGLLYSAWGDSALRVGRLADRSRLEQLGTIERPVTTGTGLAAEGSTAILYGFSDMAVIDVSRPERPGDPVPLDLEALGIEDIGSVVLMDELAYVHGLSGLSILDMTDPVRPALVGSIEVPAGAFSLEDGIVCIASDAGDLTIVDVSDPAEPEVLSSTSLAIDPSARPGGLALAAGFAYISTWRPVFEPLPSEVRTLEILDIRDPRSPSTARTMSLGGKRAIANGVAYLGDEVSIVAFDLADPAAPMRIGSWRAPNVNSLITDFAVDADRVYVSLAPDSFSGVLQVVDFSDPSAASQKSRYT